MSSGSIVSTSAEPSEPSLYETVTGLPWLVVPVHFPTRDFILSKPALETGSRGGIESPGRANAAAAQPARKAPRRTRFMTSLLSSVGNILRAGQRSRPILSHVVP